MPTIYDYTLCKISHQGLLKIRGKKVEVEFHLMEVEWNKVKIFIISENNVEYKRIHSYVKLCLYVLCEIILSVFKC